MVVQQRAVPVGQLDLKLRGITAAQSERLAELDEDGDGKISDKEILHLLQNKDAAEHMAQHRKMLLYAFAFLLVLSVFANSLLGLGFAFALKDTGSNNGDLVDGHDKKLHAQDSEEVQIVKIDGRALDKKVLLLAGAALTGSERVPVGAIERSRFLDAENNVKDSSVDGIAHYGSAASTNMVKYRVKKLIEKEGTHEMSVVVQLDGRAAGAEYQFGVTCPAASTTCTIFALATSSPIAARSLAARSLQPNNDLVLQEFESALDGKQLPQEHAEHVIDDVFSLLAKSSKFFVDEIKLLHEEHGQGFEEAAQGFEVDEVADKVEELLLMFRTPAPTPAP